MTITGQANSARLCVLGSAIDSGASMSAGLAGASVSAGDPSRPETIAGADVIVLDASDGPGRIQAASTLARELGVTSILFASDSITPGSAMGVDALIAGVPAARAVLGREPADGADTVAELARCGARTIILLAPEIWIRHQGAPERVPGLADGSNLAVGVFAGVFSTRWAEHQASGMPIDRLAVLDAVWWGQAACALAHGPRAPSRSAIVGYLRMVPGE